MENVILVDDSKFSLKVARLILHEEHNVYLATSGEDLFQLLEVVKPAIILLDIEMPQMDGYAVFKKLREEKKTENIPVIFLTAANDDKSEERALKEGAVDYIRKPFSPEVLKTRIKLHLTLRRQEKELKEAVKAADAANEAKSAFLAMMSHEMRTPLNAIIGFSQLSIESVGLSEEVYSHLTNIKSAGATMLSILSDILDISKIETGKFELIPVEYSTAVLINDVLTQSSMHRGEKPIGFNLIIDGNFPAKLLGDELRIKQVLNNLLSNAFKYTREGMVELTLSCVIEGDDIWLDIKVRDTGIGIRAKDIGGVFDEYVKVDVATNRNIVGTGLGLSISRKLARMMRGDISVESEYGKGTIFTLRVYQSFITDESLSPQVIEDLKNFCYTEQKITDDAKPLNRPNARVLVVDDVPINLAVAAGILKRYGIKTKCVTSGYKAIDAIQNDNIRYNAIFMDHLMPDMDGVETTRKIRSLDSEYAKTVPIIALTANALVGNEERFINAGFQAFISKPIELNRLDAIIREWISDEDTESNEHQKIEISESSATFNINGIDFQKGLERFDNNTKMYLNVIRSFAQNIPPLVQKLETSGIGKDYTMAIHGIRGSCYGICANEAATLAEALEAASKTGDHDFISVHNKTFVKIIKALLEDINQTLSQLSAEKKKTKKQSPDETLLKKLQQACEQNDMLEIDEIIEELTAHEYQTNNDLVEWLREMADEMNYDEIVERLEELLKG
ncbi:MAG: response regulator [Defluviitaleaceae bacterium]|nr:response regulator [Defluviitaleaceae bacterium]